MRAPGCDYCDKAGVFPSRGDCHYCDECWGDVERVLRDQAERERTGRNVACALGLVAAIRFGEYVETRVDRGDAAGEVAEYRLGLAGLWREEGKV